MAVCKLCNTASPSIAKELALCLSCVRDHPHTALPLAMAAHRKSRAAFGLPEEPPKAPDGIPCTICVNECRVPEGGMGYCGLRKNDGGKLIGVTSEEGKLSWYHDPLPTNCVGDWVCPGGTGAGHPQYANTQGPEFGYNNLAVFFHACSFNCLSCQNWHFRKNTFKPSTAPVQDLVSDVDKKTSCICYFGGDPGPQLPFAIRASRRALEKNKGRILRICWETNGSMRKGLLDEMMTLSLDSGGCIKFDLKAWDDNLHRALTGISNRRTLENFSRAAEHIGRRPLPPLVIASTLLVPGYVDVDEVGTIAKFIAAMDTDIPYSLLAFYPHFFMSDLPLTSKAQAERCMDAAHDAGLTRVRIGNVHLLAG